MSTNRINMLTITVEPMFGSSILDTVTHMVRMSGILQCVTKTSFNGITALIYPGDNPDHLTKAYTFALDYGRTHITANSPQI